MSRGRKILYTAGVVFLLVLLLPLGYGLWRARRALPVYDGDLALAGLSQPVRVLRDERAVPHLYARNLEDLLFAQGYVHAQERLWQMDLLRRTARGRLAEVVGPAAVPFDRENRVLGLGLTADRAAAALDATARGQLEAYARGVNAFIEAHDGYPLTARLPVEFALLRYRPEPWQPADSLAVGLNMFKLLYNRWRTELARAQVSERVGPERAADLYVGRSPNDRPIAEPVPPRRRPRRPRVIVAWKCEHGIEQPPMGAELMVAASNNWAVAGARTASGAPLLANDMHLPHGVPSIWFMNHLQSPEVNVIGFSLPGVPWVIAGHNGRLAWGLTNFMADTQDLYLERFDPENPSRYMTPTGWRQVERRTERIRVRGADDVELEVLETRHGPVVHEDGELKLALAWTARDAAAAVFPFLALNQAQDWEGFTRALAAYGGPPQNFVYADADGNIGYQAAGRIPQRRTGNGQVPVPGDSSQFDWTGYLPPKVLPHALNPDSGFLATANNRTVPDNYPYYLTDDWAAPARVGRLFELLAEENRFTPADMLRIQGDVLSHPDRFLAQQLRAAGAAVASHPLPRAQALAVLEGWDGTMSADSAAPLLTTRARSRLLQELLEPYLGDNWRAYQWFMSPVFLENVLTERPERWLPAGYASYDELLLAALDAAIDDSQRAAGGAPINAWRYGDALRLRFTHPVAGRIPLLRRWFSRGGQRQAGGRYTVKQTGRSYGPSERMVVDFADIDASLMNITLGQSGHVASPHYDDQLEAWLAVRSFPAPFTDAAVERAARHTLHLVPR